MRPGLVCKPRSVRPEGIPEGTAPAWMSISLGRPLPDGSSGLPEVRRRRAVSRLPEQALPLLDLAPDGGCLAAALLRTPVVFYTAVSPVPRAIPG